MIDISLECHITGGRERPSHHIFHVVNPALGNLKVLRLAVKPDMKVYKLLCLYLM